jgi:hypothetical protein
MDDYEAMAAGTAARFGRGLLTVDATGGFVYTPNLLTVPAASNPIADSFVIGVADAAFGSVDARRLGSEPARSAQVTVQVLISDTGAGVVFTSPPPMSVQPLQPLLYVPTVNAPAGAVLRYTLVGLPPSPSYQFTEADGTLNWPSVAQPADAYYRFGILVVDETSGTADYQPILLRVGVPGSSI